MRRIGIKLSALAQDGLAYGDDEYDLDRYQQAGRLAAELLSVLSGRPAGELALELGRDSGYATPKIDVRGVIFDQTGYHTSAVKLIACWDRELQGNPPPLPVHVYKLFFLCRLGGTAQPPAGLETLDAG